MNQDRELLELAAKAAGAVWAGNLQTWLKWSGKTDDDEDGAWVEWLPLDDDGDAHRLAVAGDVFSDPRFTHERDVAMFTKSMDKLTAIRWAITKVMAERQRAKEAA